MRRVTNFEALYVVFLVLLLVVLAIVFYPFDTTAEQITFYLVVLGVGALASAGASIIRRTLRTNGSIWQQPVPGRVGTILINSVVFVWLCTVGVILFILVEQKGSTKTAIAVTLLVLGGAGFGRYLQRHFTANSLLPYGISFFVALTIALVFLIATGF